MNPDFRIFTLTFFIPIFILTACSGKKIDITNEYIINENWTRQNEQARANSITINRMKIKRDSTINYYQDLSQSAILSKLEDDSTFMYYTNIRLKEGKTYKKLKIYFERDNGFYWARETRNNMAEKVKTIGNLQQGAWYKFSNLGSIMTRYIYVYIDSTNNIHRFNVSHSNL